jgi:hypothetical protein
MRYGGEIGWGDIVPGWPDRHWGRKQLKRARKGSLSTDFVFFFLPVTSREITAENAAGQLNRLAPFQHDKLCLRKTYRKLFKMKLSIAAAVLISFGAAFAVLRRILLRWISRLLCTRLDWGNWVLRRGRRRIDLLARGGRFRLCRRTWRGFVSSTPQVMTRSVFKHCILYSGTTLVRFMFQGHGNHRRVQSHCRIFRPQRRLQPRPSSSPPVPS